MITSAGPITCIFDAEPSASRVRLDVCPGLIVNGNSWRELAEGVAAEPSLRPSPPEVLAERWRRGYAAIAVRDGRIVSYISLVPILFDAVRERLGARLGIEPGRLPAVDMYGSSTGFTLAEWRRRGISLQLRCLLLARFDLLNTLYIGVTVGMGASPLLAKFDWRIAAWSEIPFVSSLAGVMVTGPSPATGRGWQVPAGLVPYEGEHVDPGAGDHEWSRYCHLWVSDAALAHNLDARFAGLMADDIACWREAVLAVFALQPGSPWTLHLFRE